MCPRLDAREPRTVPTEMENWIFALATGLGFVLYLIALLGILPMSAVCCIVTPPRFGFQWEAGHSATLPLLTFPVELDPNCTRKVTPLITTLY